MILRARCVVTMEGAPIENGAVAIEAERIHDSPPGSSPSQAARPCRTASAGSIVDVGRFAEIKTRNSGKIIDLGEQVLLPGLINAHCHLDYTCLRGKIQPQKSFTDWIRAINTEKAKLSPQDYRDSIEEGFAEAKKFGTTTIANLTVFPELTAQVRPPIRTWWFGESIDVRSPKGANEIADSAVDLLKRAPHWGLAPHAPFTASKNLYRRCEEIARRENVLLTTHLAESHEEMEMFLHSRGELAEFLAAIGRDNSDLVGVTPVAHLSELCRLDGRWLLVHLNEISLRDIELLVQNKTLPTVVHCPGSHRYFRHSQFKIGKFRKLGFNVCLGTDSLASNSRLSLFAEMRALERTRSKLWPRQILEMVTTNAARALHCENALGKIRPTFQADLIAIPCREPNNVFEEIVAFDADVKWMMINGQIQQEP